MAELSKEQVKLMEAMDDELVLLIDQFGSEKQVDPRMVVGRVFHVAMVLLCAEASNKEVFRDIVVNKTNDLLSDEEMWKLKK